MVQSSDVMMLPFCEILWSDIYDVPAFPNMSSASNMYLLSWLLFVIFLPVLNLSGKTDFFIY